MAIVNRDDFFSNLASGTKWSAGVAFTRTNALPIDDKSVFKTLQEAQTYAQSATAYPGQIIAVVDTSETTFYGINQLGELQDLGGSTAPMIFVANQSEMLALEDIEIGQQVYREDTHTIWLFKGGDASTISNWVESSAQSDCIWFGTNNTVIFYALTQTSFDGISQKDADTLYFITDSGKIYKGDQDLTGSIIPVSQFPEVSDAIVNKLYIHTTSFEVRITQDKASWITVTPGYLTDGSNWAEADGNKLATISLIKKGISEAISGIDLTATFENSTGTVKVGSGTGAVLTGVSHNPSYDAGQLKLTIPVYGGADVVVNIPKDKFVTAGQFYADYPEEEPTMHNVIVLTIDNQDDPVIIPAEALVNVYTADNEDKNVILTITEDNKVSAEITLDPTPGNALTYGDSGFMVDVSGKMSKISGATGGKIVLSTATGETSESTFTVQSTGTLSEMTATDVPVATVIAAAINAVQSALTNKVDKVVGIENNIVTFGAEGAIKDSNTKIGGATLSASPDATTLATEAAVADAISWIQLS